MPHAGTKQIVSSRAGSKSVHLSNLLFDRDLSWMKEEDARAEKMHPEKAARGWSHCKLLPL